MKRIAVLTSGGDAPGMNAVVRAITRKAIYEGLEVIGIERGYAGLLEKDWRIFTRRDVGSIVNKGGTILKTARCLEFKDLAIQEKAAQLLKENRVDALVVIGGDGSMEGAKALSRLGIPTITIPATIDNDMAGTSYTIGFDSAVNTILEAVDKIRDTTEAHERVAVVEVMGRHAGHLAVQAGLACGAQVVLIPERPISLNWICEDLENTFSGGKRYSIILVAEGAYTGYEISDYIKAHTSFAPSVTVLGYLQRGGAPSAKDAILGALMSNIAVDALLKEKYNCLVGYIDNKITCISYDDVDNYQFPVNEKEYELINLLGK